MVGRTGVGRASVALLAIGACYLAYYFSYLANYAPEDISPQGCEMSWMTPHYVLHTEFNRSWTPLASRYSLWLYRERGFDDMNERGLPVLFIPGNAGSSRQVRSIASSAARQWHQHREVGKPLDIFTVEFNEDFSAIHPPTLLSQARYTKQAVHYILSLYPKGTRIIIMGHSMGGTVAQLLLAEMGDDELRGVITMSTPSLLAPVRFDRRAEAVYAQAKLAQAGSVTATAPLITICGGSSDTQITSEVCALSEKDHPLRRTIFTTALQGAWTGVGHREMVWCHQVRYLVARAALELANQPYSNDSIDRVLRDSYTQVKSSGALVNITSFPLHYLRSSPNLILDSLERGVHLLPLPTQKDIRFTLFAYGTHLLDFPPAERLPHTIRVLRCSRPPPTLLEPACVELAGKAALIPRQQWPQRFPADKGVLDNDHVSMFEAELYVPESSPDDHISILIEKPLSQGWIVAGVEPAGSIISSASILDMLKPSGVTFSLPTWSRALHTTIQLPRLLSHSLVIYYVEASYDGVCESPKLAPLVRHDPSSIESHYHTISNPFYLQSHHTGPFISLAADEARTLSLTILSSGECGVHKLTARIAWRETMSRLGVRYWMGLAMWCIAVVGILQTISWYKYDIDGTFPSALSAMVQFVPKVVPVIGGILVILSTLPLPKEVLMGNSGQILFAPLAFLMWTFAVGLVCASQYLLWGITSGLRIVFRILRVQGSREERDTSKRWIASILFITLLVATIIPFQVAFMVIFFLQLFLCSANYPPMSTKPSNPTTSSSPTPETWRRLDTKHTANDHVLLLLTWLLPFAAPILVVWIRTLQTAGYTTPFDGDHNIFCIIPWLLIGEATVSGRGFVREHGKWKRLITYSSTGFISISALLFGPRYPFLVFEAASIAAMWIACTRVQWTKLTY